MKTVYLTKQQLHQVNRDTYMIWVYMDLAEKAVVNIESICRDKDVNRHVIRQKLNIMQKSAEVFREKLNTAHKDKPDMIEKFGEMSDAIEIQIKTDLYHSIKKELNF